MLYLFPLLQGYLLRRRWKDEEERIVDLIDAIIAKKDWTIFTIKHPSHSYGNLKYSSLLPKVKKMSESRSAAPDLRGVNFQGIMFRHINSFNDANFDFSQFDDVQFEDTNLNGSTFRFCRSTSEGGLTYRKCRMNHVTLNKAIFKAVIFQSCNGHRINICNTVFRDCLISNCEFRNIKINYESPLQAYLYITLIFLIQSLFSLKQGTYFKSLEVDFSTYEKSDANFGLYLKKNCKLIEFKRNHKLTSFIYYILFNYNISYKRLLFNIIFTWIFFGFVYAQVPVPLLMPESKVKLVILEFKPEIEFKKYNPDDFIRYLFEIQESHTFNFIGLANTNVVEPFYFSFVTLTTLGFGDIHPKNWSAQIYCCIEVFLGFLFLSSFVSISIARINSIYE